MGFEKTFLCHCPSCGKEKQSRKRDVGKLCSSCNMKKIEKDFRHLRVKENKVSSNEHQKKSREKYKDDNRYRLQKLLNQAKIRTIKKNIECDLTIEELLSIFPKNNKCPVLGIDLFWGSSGKGNRKHSPSIDRIDPKGNYTKDNIMIISWRANEIKKDCTVKEIEDVLKYMKT